MNLCFTILLNETFIIDKLIINEPQILSQLISRVLSSNKINYPMDSHLSSVYVITNIKQSTRSSNNANNISEPIRSCTRWGLQIL